MSYVVSNLNSVMDQIPLWSMGNKLIIQPATTEANFEENSFYWPYPILVLLKLLHPLPGVTIDNDLSWSVPFEKVKKS